MPHPPLTRGHMVVHNAQVSRLAANIPAAFPGRTQWLPGGASRLLTVAGPRRNLTGFPETRCGWIEFSSTRRDDPAAAAAR